MQHFYTVFRRRVTTACLQRSSRAASHLVTAVTLDEGYGRRSLSRRVTIRHRPVAVARTALPRRPETAAADV